VFIAFPVSLVKPEQRRLYFNKQEKEKRLQLIRVFAVRNAVKLTFGYTDP
jgi:hypothetical protein